MANEVIKPDFSYQWSSGGSIVAPSNVKIQTGWTAEVPPFQWENWSQNRQDNAILHLFQKGISEWDAASNYYFTASGVRSYVQGTDGNIYVAVQDSIGQDPTTSAAYWQLAFTTPATLNTKFALSGPLIGESKNLKMSVPTAATTATLTADEIVVGTALGGQPYKIASISKSINLATVGAGGMDTGVAPTSGYVGVYLIYNPSTQVSNLLAVNAASVLPKIYAGASMPAGYTASALVSVWPTNASKQFVIGLQIADKIGIALSTMFSTGTATTTPAVFFTGNVCPANAVEIDVIVTATQTVAGVGVQLVCAATSGGVDAVVATAIVSGQTSSATAKGTCKVLTPTNLYYYMTNTNNATYNIQATGYRI